jgi:hypothetical protein
MSSGHNKNGQGHHRKNGDWKAIAKGRDSKARLVRDVDPFMCAPSLTDVGSAAYRRRIAVKR